MTLDDFNSIQSSGDREGWATRLMVWDYELSGRPGCLRELWNAFVKPYSYGGAGASYANNPQLIRIRAGKFRGWVMEQSGGLDI